MRQLATQVREEQPRKRSAQQQMPGDMGAGDDQERPGDAGLRLWGFERELAKCHDVKHSHRQSEQLCLGCEYLIISLYVTLDCVDARQNDKRAKCCCSCVCVDMWLPEKCPSTQARQPSTRRPPAERGTTSQLQNFNIDIFIGILVFIVSYAVQPIFRMYFSRCCL